MATNQKMANTSATLAKMKSILKYDKPSKGYAPPIKKQPIVIGKLTTQQKKVMDNRTLTEIANLPEFVLENTQMKLLSWDDITKLSVCEITNSYEFGEGSMCDPRLGVLDRHVLCKTCHKTNANCPGHMGRIRFNHPFPHPLLLKTLVDILQCVCNCCGSLLIDNKTYKEKIEPIREVDKRVKKMSEYAKKVKCMNKHDRKECIVNPIYSTVDPKNSYKIMYSYTSSGKEQNEKSIEDVASILRSISTEDAEKLGFNNGNRPETLILYGLPVMSLQSRPFTMKEGKKSQSFLTGALIDIFKTNENLRKHDNEKDDGAGRDTNLVELYKRIYAYMDNSSGTYMTNKTEQVITIKQSLTGKEGYIRDFVSGKRNNYCARSVAGPGSLPFGYVGIPEAYRRTLTVPVTVTPYNHKQVLDWYERGMIEGLIMKSDKTSKFYGIHYKVEITKKNSYQPRINDIVERWGMDGDVIMYNRQPTLHHYGLAGHKIIFHSDLTHKSHSSITTGYNLDYDGDETNISWLQTIAAIIEALTVANITNYIMNDQSNKPMMGLVFNSPSSAYLMTKDETVLDHKSWREALIMGQLDARRIHTLPERLKKHGIKMYSGKALFSLLLPENFYYNSGNIVIRDGILKKGRITKDHIGPSSGSIVQYLFKMYSKKDVVNFFTQGQYLLDWFIKWHGLSVGYSSCIVDDPKTIKEQIREEMGKAIIQIESLEEPTTKVEKAMYEAKVIGILNNLSMIGKNISLKVLDPENAFNIMALSKAKGSVVNLAQIIGLLGQQLVRNKRPAKTLNNGGRSLPHFAIGDRSLEACGFIEENFLEGISPAGEYFHMAASREGLIDTAAGTAEVGDMHRKINKVLEDVFVNYDGCVVDKNTIFQYCFGDGFDVKHLISTKSKKLGDLVSFVDLKTIIGQLNMKHGIDRVE